MFFRANRIFVFIFALFLSADAFGQNYTARPNLEYANVNGVSLRLDLYTPNNQSAPTPLIVWIHGGGWQSGTRSLGANSPQLRQANRGYAVASISYRLSGAAKFPAQISDVKAAVRWLRANAATYNLDPSKFAAWGGSAGAHLAVLLGTSSASGFLEAAPTGNPNQHSRVQAVLDWFGPTDLTQMDAHALPCSVICHNCADSPESSLIGCPLTVCRQKARRPNPIRYIDPNFTYPPFLIMHGTADCVVPPHQSQLLHNALTSIGATSTLRYIESAGHGGAQFTTPENLALVDNFFDTHLRGQSTASVPRFSIYSLLSE